MKTTIENKDLTEANKDQVFRLVQNRTLANCFTALASRRGKGYAISDLATRMSLPESTIRAASWYW